MSGFQFTETLGIFVDTFKLIAENTKRLILPVGLSFITFVFYQFSHC